MVRLLKKKTEETTGETTESIPSVNEFQKVPLKEFLQQYLDPLKYF